MSNPRLCLISATVLAFGAPLPAQTQSSISLSTQEQAKDVRIRILSTMLTDSAGIGEWGFAAWVEVDGRPILFDTGARPDTVWRNAQELKIDIARATEVILSHNHGDHTGGLLTLRRETAKTNAKALSESYVAEGAFLSRQGPDGVEQNHLRNIRAEYQALGGRFVVFDKPKRVAPAVWLTGPVPRKYPEKNWSTRVPLIRPGGEKAEDNLPEDSSMIIHTQKGLVVVSGCGHAGIINTLTYARDLFPGRPIHAAIGGWHLFDASDEHFEWTAGKLKELAVENFLGAHCTGMEAVYRIRQLTGLSRRNCAPGAVGGGFHIGEGLIPGAIAR
jgi:7,8-dihydropterin-6-yl-methyl-4-(beta-D-ribofuranosyl)aminobenzene 5'-phosphate synthase